MYEIIKIIFKKKIYINFFYRILRNKIANKNDRIFIFS